MNGRNADPVTTLRGAGVNADLRAVGSAAIALCMAALAAAIAVLFVSGAHENAKADELRHHGVPVEATVSRCIGLMGGSGSNLVGYDCRADYSLGGHRYNEPIAGSTSPVPGAKLRAVAVPGDPTVLATPATVASEHSSWRVFLIPVVLLAIFAAAVAAIGLLWWRARLSRTEQRTD